MLGDPRDPVLAAILRATVRVNSGSGVVLRSGRTTLIATANHVVRESEEIHVRRGAGFWSLNVYGRDESGDVAILGAPRDLDDDAVALAAPDDEAAIGDPIWASGFPRGWTSDRPVLAHGAIAGVGPPQYWVNLDGTWGNSGGPICRVLDDGRPVVIGVLLGNAGEASATLDLYDRVTNKMGDDLATFSDSMEVPTPELKFWRGTMQLLASSMGMVQIAGALLRDHFRTGFLRFTPVAGLRKLLDTGDSRSSR